ncbi:dTDP-4-amino-4,6-dideoxygalactose transaminase [Pseudomonas sp. BN411]|uniref:dTDP-4-amino-4,6-dideoxygalactose transaminase n=1 Tax=Pseudomonas sp. BN411 TaxID=2567887 RepID=UPI0024548F67|nr:dTDP-4-amino-4,6-dideoxygalactose transaminase [Pseudomonas sp. BN411]MDH4562757.1 dTDP-4-amino-4,6-dideoxygalactose transaminase [Pseudomonas sp. BN411]
MIPFNKPPYTGNEDQYVLAAMRSSKISGDGDFSKRCQAWFEAKLECKKALLTPSCTHALEMAALLIDVQAGDEIIMPSYTFVSTANAFVMRGAKIVFVDIRPDTMNIDENQIEAAITSKTKAIVPVHYAGVACEMDVIMDIALRHGLFVIEDAAQGMMASYKGRPLGSIGHMGAFSFHETKNYTSGGEGGLLIINDERFVSRAEIIREKGTNRSQFFRGMVDKYSWVDIGSSYLPCDIQAAFLWGQLERSEEINKNRLQLWNSYYEALFSLASSGRVTLPSIPDGCVHNAHMFYLKANDLNERTALLEYLKNREVYGVFHYVPLHSAVAGPRFSRFHGDDRYTTNESERLIRLPVWYGMQGHEITRVVDSVLEFFA